MIPMRDGVKLKTLILIPRGAQRAPILLSRTPYGATERIAKNASAHLSVVIGDNDVAVDAVVNGGRPEPSFETGVGYLEFTEAVNLSARGGHAVELPLP